MSDSNATAGTAARFFAALYRRIPALAAFAAGLDDRARARLDGLYWILALLGTLPALRAGQLLPTSWIAELTHDLSLAGADNVFGWGAVAIVPVLLALIACRRIASRFIAIVPFVTIALVDSPLSGVMPGLNGIYTLSAFATFTYFVVAGRTRSLYFALYIAGLVLGREFDVLLTWDRIAAFVAASIVLSLVYETWRQNRTMLRELGRENFVVLIGRAFSLWSPTILLIAAGLALSQTMMSTAEELIYDGTFVERHCGIAGGPESAQFPCPETGSLIRWETLYRDLEETPDGNEYFCFYRPYAMLGFRNQGPRMERDPHSFACPDDFLIVTVPETDALIPPPVDTGGEGTTQELRRWPVERLPFERSLDLSVARQFELNEWRMQQALTDANRTALNNADEAGPAAHRLFDVVPETPGITIAACEWYDLPCHLVGWIKGILIDAYVRVRTRAETAFVNRMQARADGIAANVVGANTALGEEIDAGVGLWSDNTRDSIATLFTAYKVASVLMTLWLIVIAIKSFLYVFARVIFDRQTAVSVDLADDDTPLTEGKAEPIQEVNIPGTYPYDIYYKSNYQPLGPAPRFSIPQAFASLLSRIRFGAWNLSHVPMPCDDERGLSFNSVQADYLVDWQMADGEEVVFSYGNFVAMNENVELRTIVSLRVASLLLGRFVFHAARCRGGPGRLILRTRGRPATAKQVRQSIPVMRLVAWNSCARFSVDSHLTRTDVFLNGFNLRRSDSKDDGRPQGILIVEADARDGGVLFGTLRFAKHFLLPV